MHIWTGMSIICQFCTSLLIHSLVPRLCIFSTDCMKKAANSLVGGVLSVVWNRRSQYREQRYIAAYHRAYVLAMIAGNWRCAAV